MNNNLIEVSNIVNVSNAVDVSHEMHMRTKDLCRYCEENNIPIFIAYYLAKKGYQYKGLFPEEIQTEEVLSEYGKFKEFLKIVIGFNKEDYIPQIKE